MYICNSIVDDSVITSNEIIDVPDTVSINFHDKKASHKMNCYIFHPFYEGSYY